MLKVGDEGGLLSWAVAISNPWLPSKAKLDLQRVKPALLGLFPLNCGEPCLWAALPPSSNSFFPGEEKGTGSSKDPRKTSSLEAVK